MLKSLVDMSALGLLNMLTLYKNALHVTHRQRFGKCLGPSYGNLNESISLRPF